ncbi:glycine receptor subunit alpha-1-like [Pollicipes pollicipes]|uniref:glycine receptor subunit alpha-1-like n=1 Tax=Pollicipes pollicipes TaxID=41117 RepID=UPI001884C5E1|nr:glycine receptor subunit alpha-1-like [Pollicipes pollicipes]
MVEMAQTDPSAYLNPFSTLKSDHKRNDRFKSQSHKHARALPCKNGAGFKACKLLRALVLLATVLAVGSANLIEGRSASIQPRNGSVLSNTTNTSKLQPGSGDESDPLHLACAEISLVCHHYNRMVPQSINFTAEERERNVTCEIGSEAERSEQCTTVVRIIVDILQIKDVNEEFGIVRLLMVLRQFWSDGRLDLAPEYRDTCPYIQEVNNGSAGYVPSEAHRKVWVPDLYLIRVEEVYRPEILAAAETFRVDEHGNVTYVMFGVFKLSCPMDFQNFPMDVQYCPIYIESWRLEQAIQTIMWDPHSTVGVSSDYSLDQFSFGLRILKVGDFEYATGTFSRIGVALIFSRKLQFYVLQIYFPTVLFVIISWMTFIIPPAYAQGRIILTITTMLTLAALYSLVSMHSPSTSYIKAIDVWMFVCLLFVFAAVVDCLIDIRLLFVVSQSYKQERLGFLTPVSVALVENRRVFDDLFGGLDDEPAATPSVFFDAPSRPELPPPSPATRLFNSILRRSDAAENRGGLAVNFAAEVEQSAPPPSAAHADTASERWTRAAKHFEKASFVVYPAAFLLFNVCYWAYYLNAARPPDKLAEEMRLGFTPKPRES